MSRRLKIIVEYNGTDFVGWQAQNNGPSVQEAIEGAIFGFSGERLRIEGAGRTDSGVHAYGQVAHFDLEKDLSPQKVMSALNAHLRDQAVVVLAVEEVDGDFSARFKAKRRHYLYRILNRPAPPVLEMDRVWHVPRLLDVAAMAEAAQILVGSHDFTTFRSINCQAKSPVKTLDQLDVISEGQEIHFVVSARSFLHRQVRSMVGSLKMVGEGRWSAADLAQALEARDRKAVGFSAPAGGLYLVGVDY